MNAKRGLNISKNFPKVSSVVSMNSLLILPWNWKYFSVYSGRKDAAQLNEGREKDWKQIKMTLKKAAATKGTLASHIFFVLKLCFKLRRTVKVWWNKSTWATNFCVVWFCVWNKETDFKQEYSDSAKVALAFNIHASKIVRNASKLAL